ncbi:MAG: hypothetical protein LBN39_12995 [Planctomycetaceae bacterium]|jgi:glycosylphosphatidylinositol transamidase (GPIT) subunit GPI8|nr:hypothetical protein [Planctomycetaceae bacterium]
MRHLSIFTLCLLLTGCGLMESRKKPNIEEVPPYYQSNAYQHYHDEQRENMTQQVHTFRNRELEKLEKAEKDEKENEPAKKTEETKEKKKWLLFGTGKGSDSFLRSGEAARISANLDR